MPAGISTQVVSADADQVRINADVYYEGTYQSVISANVIAAIGTFLATVPFNGITYLVELEKAIKAVTGVVDVELSFISLRAATDAFSPGGNTIIYDLANGINNRKYIPYAGYSNPETTPSYTLTDTLNFIISD
jgi:hypothetical protein